MDIAYVRVSTMDQNEARQVKAMLEAGIEKDNIHIEKASGKGRVRPVLMQLLNSKLGLRKGDTLYIESFSRLARNTKDLLDIVEELKEKDVKLISLKEKVDTSTPTGKLMLNMLGTIYQFERDCLLERQREGIEIAKAKGKYKGRKPIDYPENWQEVYSKVKAKEITATKGMELLDMKRTTFYKLINRYEQNQQQAE